MEEFGLNKCYRIMWKSYFREGKMGKVFAFIALVCMIILTVFGILMEINRQKGIIRGEELYGKYQFGIIDLSENEKNMLQNDDTVDSISVFKSQVISVSEICTNVGEIYTDKSYMENSGSCLMRGRFPEADDEVACNMILLYKYGISSWNEGAVISVNGQEYKVTGVIDRQNYDRDNENIECEIYRNINTDSAEKINNYNILVLTGRRDFDNIYKELLTKYNIDKSHSYVNRIKLRFASIDTHGNFTGIMKIYQYVYYTMYVMCGILIVSVVNIYIKKLSGINHIYTNMGVGDGIKTISFLLNISVIMIVCTSFVNLISITFTHNVLNMKNVCNNVVVLNTVFVFFMIIISTSLFQIDIKSICKNNRRSRKIKDNKAKSVLTVSRNIYITIARESRTSAGAKNVILMCVLIMSGIVVSGIIYFVSQYDSMKRVKTDYEYKVSFSSEVFRDEMFGTDAGKKMYDYIHETKSLQDVLDIYKYESSARVEQKKLSKEYKSYLSNLSTEMNEKIIEKSRYITMGIVIVGVDESNASQLGIDIERINELKEYQCYILKNTLSSNGKGYVSGIDKNDTFVVEQFNGSDMSCIKEETYIVKDVFENINTEYFDEYYTPIIILPVSEYKKFIPKDYPQYIYFNMSNQGSEDVIKYISCGDETVIQNLNSQREELKSYTFFMTITSVMIYFVTVILVISNCIVISYVRYDNMKEQLVMLNAMGIPYEAVNGIYIYEIVMIYIKSILLELFLSFAGIYILYKQIIKQIGYYAFEMPFSIIFLPNILNCIILTILICVFIKKSNIKKNIGILNE